MLDKPACGVAQVDSHLMAELQVVLADKAALEEEKDAAQVRSRQRTAYRNVTEDVPCCRASCPKQRLSVLTTMHAAAKILPICMHFQV